MNLIEHNTWQAESIADGIIHNVKVLGAKSNNKRTYPASTRQAMLPLLEGCTVNLDHQYDVKKHSVASRFGKIKNVRFTEEGTFADLHFLTQHPMAPAIIEAAQKMPELLGLSIFANGKLGSPDKDGNQIVESVANVKSVDLVAVPATTSGLYEAEQEEPATSEEHLLAGMKNAVAACLDEDCPMADKIKKITTLLKGYSKMAPDKEEEAEEDDVKESYQSLKAEKDCRLLCESNSIEPEQTLIEALVALPEVKREAHVKYLKQKSLIKPIKTPNLGAAKIDKPRTYTEILKGIN